MAAARSEQVEEEIYARRPEGGYIGASVTLRLLLENNN